MNLAGIREDSAENSIMQTISIAVSAILIAAGLITAPGLINNAKDINAQSDVSSIANAQNFQQSDTGNYTSSLPVLLSNKSLKLVTSSANTSIGLISGVNCFATFVQSASGNIFYGSSVSSPKLISAPWPAAPPTGYPWPCVAWPPTALVAAKNSFPPLSSSSWTMSGVTYDDASQVVTFAANGSLISPLIDVTNGASVQTTVDAMLPSISSSANQNMIYFGIYYYQADGITPATSPTGYTSNGNAIPITSANTWSRAVSSLGSGTTGPQPNIAYMKIALYEAGTFGQVGLQLRGPTFTITKK